MRRKGSVWQVGLALLRCDLNPTHRMHPESIPSSEFTVVGLELGDREGEAVGRRLGWDDGNAEGPRVGPVDGEELGSPDGETEGPELGADEGPLEGGELGSEVGGEVGLPDGMNEGEPEGPEVGVALGRGVGTCADEEKKTRFTHVWLTEPPSPKGQAPVTWQRRRQEVEPLHS